MARAFLLTFVLNREDTETRSFQLLSSVTLCLSGWILDFCKRSIKNQRLCTEGFVGYIWQGLKCRPCKIIPLKDAYACFIQPVIFIRGLNPFRNDFDRQGLADLLDA